MKKFNESKFLTWVIFNSGTEGHIAMGILLFLPVLIFTLCMTAGPYWHNPAIVLPPIMALYAALIAGIPNVGKLHVLHSVPKDNYRNNYSLRKRATEYLSLGTADRALYPRDIIETIKDPDLTRTQKENLDTHMLRLYKDIKQREAEKARFERELHRRHIDVDETLAHLEDARESVKAETSVYSDELRRQTISELPFRR